MSDFRVDIVRAECSSSYGYYCACGDKDAPEQLCLHFRADCGGDEIFLCKSCLEELLERMKIIEAFETHRRDLLIKSFEEKDLE